MARGRGAQRGAGFRQKYMNRKSLNNDVPKRKQYEEFGEAHPIEEKEVKIKRLKVEDTEENFDSDKEVEKEESDLSGSEDEQTSTDAVSRLLATFNTNVNKAIDSDEEEQEEDSDDSDDDEEDDSEGEEEEELENVINEEEEIVESSSCGEVDSTEEAEDHEEDGTDGGMDDDNEEDDVSETLNEDAESSENEQEESGESDDEEGKDDNDDSPHTQKDSFVQHFEKNLDESGAEQVKDPKKWISNFQKWPTLGRIKVEVPKVEARTSKLLLLEDEQDNQSPPSIGVVPQPPERNYSLDDYHIRKVIQRNLPHGNVDGSNDCPSSLTDLQKELLSVLSTYSDLYYPDATHSHWEEVRTVYATHILNHVLKTRKRIVNHSAKLKKFQSGKKLGASGNYRDQGYARPTVLVLLPFKHSAYRLVETLVILLFGNQNPNVQNLQRFREDYGPVERQSKGTQGRAVKPDDFQAIFNGDINEDFKIGLKISKSSIKLYADFYQSDIILASPLGLRYIMGTASVIDAETDFLSSVEILILDQADIFLMQNWEHVLVVGEGMNQLPRNLQQLGTDLSRVRLWTLDGLSHLYRQTILFASTLTDHNRAFLSKCTNFAGRMQVLNPVENGTAGEVVVDAEMVITRIPGLRDPDARFHHFTRELLPRLRSGPPQPGTMVYVPDYCDYVRLLRHLKEDRGISVATINEYMVGENSKVAKARSLFFDGRRRLLLFTERFHFYRRYRIKGVRHVIFYDLPTYPHFFSEMCNLMVEGNQNPRLKRVGLGANTVSVLVQKSDLTRLVGILGSSHAAQIISATKPVHICALGK